MPDDPIMMIFPALAAFSACLPQLAGWFGAVGEWRALADRYRTDRRPPGRLHRCSSVRIGSSDFGVCLHVGIERRGLYLAPASPLQRFTPPLLVPWDAVRAEKTEELAGSHKQITIPEKKVILKVEDAVHRRIRKAIRRTN